MQFVQFADAHLDSTLGGALNLPVEKRDVLRQDLRRALARGCQLAREQRVDLVLVPGDLFDYESLDDDTVSFLVDVFGAVAPAKVYIAPGNHDSLRPGSPYLKSAGAVWPENVHVFLSQGFETVQVPDIGCCVTGIAHAHRGITDRLAVVSGQVPACAPDTVSILLLHASRIGYRPSDKENVLPFSDDELLSLGFAYTALGHYHSFGQITDAEGRIRAAYSGCIQGRGLDETGEKCVLLGSIEPNGDVQLEQVEVAERRVVAVEADLTGSTDRAAIIARTDSAVKTAGAREQDIVHVSLTGAVPLSITFDASALELTDRYFHVVVSSSRMEPDYDLEELARDSAASPLRSAFVRRMMELRAQASSPEEEQVVREATYYGLQALDGRRLEPRRAD